MNNHTTGPWEVVDGAWPGFIEVKGPSFRLSIVTSATDLDFSDYMVRHADARLIAAAPESHKANVLMVDSLNVAFHIDPDWDDERIYDELPSSGVANAYFLARAAIAKATGAA